MEDYVQIVPGASLNNYAPTHFQVRSIRIDNPSGCWYQLVNNRQIIPPFTYGLVVVLQADSGSLSVRFLASFAGQQSKLVGNPLQLFLTSHILTASNPLNIANAVPYTNTFFAGPTSVTSARLGAPGGVGGSLVIKPSVSMRLRLVYLLLENMSSATAGIIIGSCSVQAFSAVTPSVVVTSQSQDTDPAVVSQSVVSTQVGNAVTALGNPLRKFSLVRTPPILIGAGPTLPTGRIVRAWYMRGPEMPPMLYKFTNSAAIALGVYLDNVSDTINAYTIDVSIGWTEEPLG